MGGKGEAGAGESLQVNWEGGTEKLAFQGGAQAERLEEMPGYLAPPWTMGPRRMLAAPSALRGAAILMSSQNLSPG